MTHLCRLLGIEVPIVQAPIGNASCPELVAAVCEAGALGMLSVTWRKMPAVRQVIREVRDRTARPFGVNLVLEWGQDERLDACLEEGARIVSFFWGEVVGHHADGTPVIRYAADEPLAGIGPEGG